MNNSHHAIFLLKCLQWLHSSVVALVVKNLPANAGDKRNTSLIPGSGKSPGGRYGSPLQYSRLENPMDRGAWQATVQGVTESQTQLKQPSMHPCIQNKIFSPSSLMFTAYLLFPGCTQPFPASRLLLCIPFFSFIHPFIHSDTLKAIPEAGSQPSHRDITLNKIGVCPKAFALFV